MKRTLTRVLVSFLSLLLGTHLTTQAQSRAISGKVTNDMNEPVAGASVLVKARPTSGTTTGLDGTFKLTVTSTDDSLSISAVGFETQTVAITNDILVRLSAGRRQLDEIVVIGYGTSRKSDLTAPVTVVNTENMLKRTTTNAMEALQGAVPGVQVVTAGAPGSSPDVRIRGVGSFNNENPLYVVDGMFVNDISFLNPSDIADMSVLKDASGAAIYGVRAANGVVLITTKKGAFNMKTRVTYNGYVGFQTPAHRLRMANGAQYAAFSLGRLSATDSGTARLSAQKYGGSGLNPTTSTDWYGELLRSNAMITNHGIDVQGGGDKITYSLGGNYTYQNGIMKALNDFKRYNVHVQVEAKAYSWLKVGFTAHLNNSTTFYAPNSAWSQAYNSSPLFPVYDSTNVNAAPVKFANSSTIGRSDANPVATAYYNYNRAKGFQILPTIYAEAAFWNSKLTFRSQLSQLYSSLNGISYGQRRNLGPGTDFTPSHLDSRQERNTNYVLDNLLTYRDGKGPHHWSVLLGQSTREERWRRTSVGADNVLNVEEFWYATPNQGQTNASFYSEDGSRNANISYFTRGTYDYDNKYLLTATFRADGSSKYQTKYGYFPSVGLGWVISREDFMKDQKIFDFLKLRGSWGKLGNDGVTPNAAYAKIQQGNNYSGIFGSSSTTNGQYVPGYSVDRYFATLAWEVVTEWDGGIDFELLGRKLRGSVDYYHRKTTDLAFNSPIPLTYRSVYANVGDMVNSGFDVVLNWSDRIGKLGYSIGGNISTLKNKVTSLGGLPLITSGFPEWTAEFPNRSQVGQPINYFYGYQFTGIYQTQDEVDKDPIAAAYNATATNKIVAGFPKYKDQDGNGILDDKDRINMGSYLPKFTYGFNVALDYKGFDMSVTFQGVAGAKILNLNRGKLYKASTTLNLDEKFAQGLWTGAGSTNAYPSAYAIGQSWFKVSNSFFVESGAYLRIQNIQLGYSFNVGKTSPVGLRVFATADRPAIFTKYSGFTPDIPRYNGGGMTTYGYDANVYPSTATYSLGVRATF